MTDNDFEIKILDLHWLDYVDDPADLCAHGHVFLKIAGQIVSEEASGDWTVSATALLLLRTIEKDYEKDDYSAQLLPCCGQFIVADENGETVTMQGCDTGIDWQVKHTTSNKVRLILDNGAEAVVDAIDYKSKVLDFADEVEQFYRDSKLKLISGNDFDKKGYHAFWREWRSLPDKWH